MAQSCQWVLGKKVGERPLEHEFASDFRPTPGKHTLDPKVQLGSYSTRFYKYYIKLLRTRALLAGIIKKYSFALD